MAVDGTDGLLTPKEAAKLLGVSRGTIYRWVKRKWLAYIELPNGTIRVQRQSINSVLAGK